jgi:hypothetical protein
MHRGRRCLGSGRDTFAPSRHSCCHTSIAPFWCASFTSVCPTTAVTRTTSPLTLDTGPPRPGV